MLKKNCMIYDPQDCYRTLIPLARYVGQYFDHLSLTFKLKIAADYCATGAYCLTSMLFTYVVMLRFGLHLITNSCW